MKIGPHVSIQGGIDKAPSRAHALKGNCTQIFCRSPRGWKNRLLANSEAENTKKNLKKYNIDPLVVHSTYLINLASWKKDLHEKSIKTFEEEYKICELIGATYLVFHPGKWVGSSREKGIQKIINSINQILYSQPNNPVQLLLENVAGAGSEIGKTFEELQEIIEKIDLKERIGICFDTCHAFAAGYDLRTEEGVNQVFEQFDKIIGIEKLKCFHSNDSKFGLGEKKDRHEHIGLGKIGDEGFRAIVNHPYVVSYDIPFILETPVDERGDVSFNMEKLKSFRESPIKRRKLK